MVPRFRPISCLCLVLLLTMTSGCSDRQLTGPLSYIESEALTKEIKNKGTLADKPVLQDRVRKGLATLYGERPNEMKVPDGMGELFSDGSGARLAKYRAEDGKVLPNLGPNQKVVAGGFGLYRKNCLHCHGVSGAGDGPTSAFLFPVPRDFRAGLFKFTSTPNGARPHRDDLVRSVKNGLHGTSMPAFEALMTDEEINEVVDYIIFLSVRGETEIGLIEEGAVADETDDESLSEEIIEELEMGVVNKWKSAKDQVINPPSPIVLGDRDSILRGRDLYLGKTKEKLECAACHGMLGRGDGPSFVPQDVFNHVVFGGNPSERQQRIDELDEKMKELWGQKLDEWGNPLRPANLNRGVYKGGRRPIDLYWRIAKGITGAQMPAHYPTINENQIWDLVNFVLVLPYEPGLLEGATTSAAPAVSAR